MRTTFRARQPYADIFLKCAREMPCLSEIRPARFMKLMETNQGSIGILNGMGLDEEGLERKNPVIAGLGDSVTAGHFESLLPQDSAKAGEYMAHFMELVTKGDMDGLKQLPANEITDARESYLEKFRNMLIEKYERTSVSVINAGIAGDNLLQMSKRLGRDVIRYQPDLVLINGSLNWDEKMQGSTALYKTVLRDMIRRIKQETEADIVLLTPNGDLPNTLTGSPDAEETTTIKRVQVIRELAKEEKVCLADIYAVWEKARNLGCPWKELLANGINHPGVEGHEAYAITIMKLFEE